MKKSIRSRRNRRQNRVQELEPRLRAYSAAGSAALATTAVALTATATAEAQITTIPLPSPSSLTVPSLTASNSNGAHNESFALNLGSGEVVFGGRQSNYKYTNAGTRFYAYGRLRVSGVFGSVHFAGSSSSSRLVRFVGGNPINESAAYNWGSYGVFFSTGSANESGFSFGQNRNGNFAPATGANQAVTGYVGFQFYDYANSRFDFGWLHVRVGSDANGRPNFVGLVADENNVVGAFDAGGAAILAGDTGAAIPEPTSVATGLALFALGAAGVHELRRRRKSA